MFWAGFGEVIRTSLVPLDGDPEAPPQGEGIRPDSKSALYQAWLPE